MLGEQSGELKLPKWVKVSEKRFNEILSTVTKAKNDVLETSVYGGEIALDNTDKLLKDTASEKIDGNEFKKEYNNIANDVEAIVNWPIITRNKKNSKKNIGVKRNSKV